MILACSAKDPSLSILVTFTMLFVVTSISEVTSSPPFTIAPPATSRDTPATTVGGETLVYPIPNTPTFPTYAVAAVAVPPEIAMGL